MANVKACGVLVFRDQPRKEFLLLRHSHRFDLPKGHLDPGETEIECALRELREETGILAESVELDPNFRFTISYEVRASRLDGRPALKTVVIFLGRLLRETDLKLTEHATYHWHPWSPPHRVQVQTIDPLLAAVESYWRTRAPGA